MKNRWLVIGAIVLIVILFIALVVYFLLPKPVPATTPLSTNPFSDAVVTGTANNVTSPATFSVNFYKWYIANREANSNFPTTDQLTTEFSQWTTSNFILYYQSSIHNVNIDADPVLYAQDDPLQWGAGMTATILSQTDTTSSVQVVIGSGSLAHTYTVKLVKNNEQWLIDSISGTY